ncbi:hypothetical protein [Streptomyces sp. NBC_00525]|uniref:hypothetical protein n=1 Tax=Streptomyces sp. NBC_00525 TaxID=2903660 RepID=UPI003FCDC8C9
METGLHYNVFRHCDPETGRYASPAPLGLAPAPNPVAYVNNPHRDDVIENAPDGRFRKHPAYHADTRHGFTDERVLEILKNPDAVYHSTGSAGNLIFRQGEDVVLRGRPGHHRIRAVEGQGKLRSVGARWPGYGFRWAGHARGHRRRQDSE